MAATYRVTLTAVWEIKAANEEEAEAKVRERVCAPEDNPPGVLTNWKIKARAWWPGRRG